MCEAARGNPNGARQRCTLSRRAHRLAGLGSSSRHFSRTFSLKNPHSNLSRHHLHKITRHDTPSATPAALGRVSCRVLHMLAAHACMPNDTVEYTSKTHDKTHDKTQEWTKYTRRATHKTHFAPTIQPHMHFQHHPPHKWIRLRAIFFCPCVPSPPVGPTSLELLLPNLT